MTNVSDNMRRHFLFAALLAVAGGKSALYAQANRVSGSLSGEIVDTLSHLPVRRASVCEQSGHIVTCHRADSLGRFVYSPVSGGVHTFTISCDNGNRRILLASKLLQTLRLTVSSGEHRVIHLGVDANGCDQRPFQTRAGEYWGHYAAGFELSDFAPCDGSPGDAAWVEWTEKARNQRLPTWPDSGAVLAEQQVFVRWIGTLEGPYRYGHMGLASYQLWVDSIIEVRAADAGDCHPGTK